jgi:hypothetical protein
VPAAYSLSPTFGLINTALQRDDVEAIETVFGLINFLVTPKTKPSR